MARKYNTDVNGKDFIDAVKKQVWEKGKEITGYSKDKWRSDVCGGIMEWDNHGNRESKYGWEVDHIKPVAKDGGDELTNLQPLNWKNNASKSDKYPWKCGE